MLRRSNHKRPPAPLQPYDNLACDANVTPICARVCALIWSTRDMHVQEVATHGMQCICPTSLRGNKREPGNGCKAVQMLQQVMKSEGIPAARAGCTSRQRRVTNDHCTLCRAWGLWRWLSSCSKILLGRAASLTPKGRPMAFLSNRMRPNDCNAFAGQKRPAVHCREGFRRSG